MKSIPFFENDYWRSMAIFQILSHCEFELFVENMSCSLHKSGSVLYKQDCLINGVFILISGIVKQVKYGPKGKEHILRFAKRGDVIGFRSNITDEMACSTSIVVEDAVVCYLPGKLLSQLMQTNSNFGYYMIQQVCNEIEETQKFILNIAQKKVRERVADALIHLMKRFELDHDNYLKIPLSRRELASMVGTAPESTIRMLADFKREKLIDLQGRSIQFLNVKKLTKIGEVSLKF